MIVPQGSPLEGLRVLELCQFAAGPFTGSLLADLGADVVKVERPDGGDPLRQWPPFSEGADGEAMSHNFVSVNRNKRSLRLDLKDPADREQLKDLAAAADIFVENFRPGVLTGMGLGYDDLKPRNEKLIYCSISGYGQTGPYARKGAFDATVQGISGLMSVTGEVDGDPVKCGVPFGDFCTGLYGAYAVLAAVRRRDRTGLGGYIDCSMLGSLIGVAALQTSEFFGTGIAPKALGSAHPRNAPYQGFKGSDGYFMLAAGTDDLWRRVCDVVDRQDLADDPRFAKLRDRVVNQVELAEILSVHFKERTVDEWVSELDARGVPSAPVKNYAELAEDEHVAHMGLIQDIDLPNGQTVPTTMFPISVSDFEFEVYRAPPRLGEHNDEVMAEWLSPRGDARADKAGSAS